VKNTVFVMKTYFASHRYLDAFIFKSNLRENRKFPRERQLVILNGSFCVKLLAEYFTK